MPRTGRCPNFAGCLLAHRNDLITVPDDAPFVCPECGLPLAGGKPVAIQRIHSRRYRAARRHGRCRSLYRGRPYPGSTSGTARSAPPSRRRDRGRASGVSPLPPHASPGFTRQHAAPRRRPMNPDSTPDEPTAYLAILAGLPPRAFPLVPGRFILGRSPEVDFHLDDLQVSRRHCEVEYEDGTCWVDGLAKPLGHGGRLDLHHGPDGPRSGRSPDAGRRPARFPFRPGSRARRSRAPRGRRRFLRRSRPDSLPRRSHAHHPAGRDHHHRPGPGSDVVLDSSAVARRQVHILRRTRRIRGGRFAERRSLVRQPPRVYRASSGHWRPAGGRPVSFPLRWAGAARRQRGGRRRHPCARGLRRGRAGAHCSRIFPSMSRPAGFAGIIGVGGAPLSPLISVLAGRAAPSAGAVTVDGVPAAPGSAMRCGLCRGWKPSTRS